MVIVTLGPSLKASQGCTDAAHMRKSYTRLRERTLTTLLQKLTIWCTSDISFTRSVVPLHTWACLSGTSTCTHTHQNTHTPAKTHLYESIYSTGLWSSSVKSKRLTQVLFAVSHLCICSETHNSEYCSVVPLARQPPSTPWLHKRYLVTRAGLYLATVDAMSCKSLTDCRSVASHTGWMSVWFAAWLNLDCGPVEVLRRLTDTIT